jgi:hypothetical protein
MRPFFSFLSPLFPFALDNKPLFISASHPPSQSDPPLKSLSLRFNDLRDKGATEMARGVAKNTNLIELNLQVRQARGMTRCV